MKAGRSAAAISSASSATAAGSGAAPRPTAGVDVGHLAGRRPEDVEREVDEHRPAVRGHRRRHRFVHGDTGLGGVGQRARGLRDRRQDRHVVQLLQRAGPPPSLRCPATEHDDRRPVEPRRRHRRHAVGDPRAGRQRGDAGPAGQLGPGLGGERGRLLVAGVDDPHPLVARRLVERPDVPTVEREHHVHAEAAQRGDGLLPGVALDHPHASTVSGGSTQPTPEGVPERSYRSERGWSGRPSGRHGAEGAHQKEW